MWRKTRLLQPLRWLPLLDGVEDGDGGSPSLSLSLPLTLARIKILEEEK